MTSLAVVTPSWLPDIALFDDLHASVVAHLPADTVHHVIVPWLHRRAFARYEEPRCRIWTHPELMPRRYVRLPGGIWENVLRPWPPVRGWVMQQAAKLAATAAVDADVVLLIDSDVVLVRPATPEHFLAQGRPVLVRDEGAIHAGMRRHVLWHDVSRRLLSLPVGPPPPLPDYVSPVGIWEPATVRALQDRIRQTTGRHWLDAFTAELHISEFIVYGVFADQVLNTPATRAPARTTLCHNSWQRTPLTVDEGLRFAEQLGPDAIAIMISSHSRTPLPVRRAVLRRCSEMLTR